MGVLLSSMLMYPGVQRTQWAWTAGRSTEWM